MKIFYVIDSYEGPFGGTEKQLLFLLREMQRHGHEVRLFVLRHTAYTRNVDDFPCPIELLEIASIRSLASLQRLLKFRSRVAREKPDVVHAFFNDAAILVPLFCRIKGTRIITSRRDMGFWYSRTKLMLLRLVNLRVDHIVCNCDAVARHVARMEWIPARKLAVILNALPTSGSLPRAAPRADRAFLRICLLANIRPIKRMEDFISAAALVSRSHPCVEFVIIGEISDKAYYQELQTLAKELGLTDQLIFAGRTDNPAEWLNRSDIGALTSLSEGLSNSILEYMSAALPVVCSDVGGNPELIAHRQNGYLYPVGDTRSLAKYLERLCSNSELRTRLGCESRRRLDMFASGKSLKQQIRLYEGTMPETNF